MEKSITGSIERNNESSMSDLDFSKENEHSSNNTQQSFNSVVVRNSSVLNKYLKN